MTLHRVSSVRGTAAARREVVRCGLELERCSARGALSAALALRWSGLRFASEFAALGRGGAIVHHGRRTWDFPVVVGGHKVHQQKAVTRKQGMMK